jgi:hypothetical protein
MRSSQQSNKDGRYYVYFIEEQSERQIHLLCDTQLAGGRIEQQVKFTPGFSLPSVI